MSKTIYALAAVITVLSVALLGFVSVVVTFVLAAVTAALLVTAREQEKREARTRARLNLAEAKIEWLRKELAISKKICAVLSENSSSR